MRSPRGAPPRRRPRRALDACAPIRRRTMLAALPSTAVGALLDVTKFQPPAPCNTATAATSVREHACPAETPDDAVWFSVMPSVGIPAAPVDLSTLSDWNTPEAPLPMVGGPKPVAVGQVVLSAARIDCLVCALAQEDDDHDACLQAVVDAPAPLGRPRPPKRTRAPATRRTRHPSLRTSSRARRITRRTPASGSALSRRRRARSGGAAGRQRTAPPGCRPSSSRTRRSARTTPS